MPISVRQDGTNSYSVIVSDAEGSTSHLVTVWPSDIARYAPDATVEALLEAAFEFLLERESKDAILPRFELPVIERYFPEFPQAMAARFA